MYIDPDGKTVINGDQRAFDNASSVVFEAEGEMEAFDEDAGLTNKEFKAKQGKGEQFKVFKSAKNYLKQVNKDLAKAEKAFQKTQAATNSMKFYRPNEFEQLNNLSVTPKSGQKVDVDVLVTFSQLISDEAQIFMQTDKNSGVLFYLYSNNDRAIQNAIEVRINSSISINDVSIKFAHESVHVLWQMDNFDKHTPVNTSQLRCKSLKEKKSFKH